VATAPPHPYKVPVKARLLEGFVRAEVQRQARVGEEEVQAAKVEEVVAADLAGKHLDGTRETHWVQQSHLQEVVTTQPSRASCTNEGVHKGGTWYRATTEALMCN